MSRVIGDGEIGLKDGAFKEAELHQPQGLAVSEDGKTLYIADTENHALRAADLVRAAGDDRGHGQQAHQFPDDSPAKTTAISSPWDLARVGDHLYIAMAGVHQIWAMDLAKGTIKVFAGTGREGAVDGANAQAGFAQPSGLASEGVIVCRGFGGLEHSIGWSRGGGIDEHSCGERRSVWIWPHGW